jgi:hypothetical protein
MDAIIEQVTGTASAIIGILGGIVAVLSAMGYTRAAARAADIGEDLDTVIRGIERLGRSSKISAKEAKRAIQGEARMAGIDGRLHERVKAVTEPDKPRSRRRTAPPPVSGILAVLALSLLAGCRTLTAEDVTLIRTARAVNAAHAADVTLPPQARQIALDAHDVLCVLEFSATGHPVPAEVRERLHEGER